MVFSKSEVSRGEESRSQRKELPQIETQGLRVQALKPGHRWHRERNRKGGSRFFRKCGKERTLSPMIWEVKQTNGLQTQDSDVRQTKGLGVKVASLA